MSEVATSRPHTASSQRALHVLSFGVLCLAGLGFISGTRQAESPRARVGAAAPGPVGSRPEAPRYDELRDASLSPNAGWKSQLPLAQATPRSASPTVAGKLSDLERRATRRAYAGAPPVIPHRVDELRADACLACHGAGLTLGAGFAAPTMPHAELRNCLQCHAAPPPSFVSGEAASPRNGFQGEREPERGARAWLGAPPVIPHATDMRADCLACHGPASAYPNLRTSHPERVSCRQCHAATTSYPR